MDQTIGMVEAKSKLSELVGQVKYGGKRFVLERRGRPMAVLVSVEEYERLQAQASAATNARPSPLSAELRRRQEVLLARARILRDRLGPPEDGLAVLFAGLPAEDDDFWTEIQEPG